MCALAFLIPIIGMFFSLYLIIMYSQRIYPFWIKITATCALLFQIMIVATVLYATPSWDSPVDSHDEIIDEIIIEDIENP